MFPFVLSSHKTTITTNKTKRIILYGILNNLQIRTSSDTEIFLQICMPKFMSKRITKKICKAKSDLSTATQDLQNYLQSTLESFYKEFTLLRDITSTNSDNLVEFICIVLNPDIIQLIQLVYTPSDKILYDIIQTVDDALSKYSEYFEILSPPSSASCLSASSPFSQELQPIFDNCISTIPFPNESNQVIYLSGDSGANDFAKLSELGITHILNVSDCIPNYYENTNSITYMRVPIQDYGSICLRDYFTEVFKFITNALESGGRILVHCFAGKSRSASFVIAYLMQRYRMNFIEALQHVQTHRAVVEPNLGFELQLHEYEKLCI